MNKDCDGYNDVAIRKDGMCGAYGTLVTEDKCLHTSGGKVTEETMWKT